MCRRFILRLVVVGLCASCACDSVPWFFGPPPSIDGDWRSTFSGSGAACLTVGGATITSYANCGGSPYSITSNPAAAINGNRVQVEVTFEALPGVSNRTVFDLEWRQSGSLVGTAENFLNGVSGGITSAVWQRD